MQGLLQKALSILLAAAAAVQAYPAGVVEFAMRKPDHDQVNWYGKDTNLEQIREESERNFDSRNHGKCPTEMKTGSNLPVNEKSTCPWYYEVSHDGTRYPPDILIAKSNCTTCIGNNGDFQCHPVVRTIQVLYEKTEDSGYVTYEARDISIPIGFTCGSRDMAANVVTTPAPATTMKLPFTFARRK